MSKVSRIVALVGLIAVLVGSAVALASTSEIRDRIKPTGEVRLGEGAQRASTQVASARPGPEVYDAACGACHNSGAAGAPRLGRTSEWAERVAQDTETLYDHAINGIGSMPPKGGCADCSDEEVQNAVDYMLSELE